MSGSCRPGLVVLASLMWAAALASAAAGRQDVQGTAAKISVWDGVYSESQASRGLEEFTRSCERCHGADLTGNATDEVPALVADNFMFHWGRRPLQDLYERIRKTMPADAPGALAATVYLDIVAYLLEANGFPRGPRDLARNQLNAIFIERAASR